MFQVFSVLIITAITCSMLGSFLVLRNLSMVCDALSHSVLLGIVLAFVIVKKLDSVYLLLGATLLGVITVWLVEQISQKGIVKNDDALGIVFPMFFSIAVIIISKFFRNVNLDVEIVLMGEVLFSPFKVLFGLPRDFIIMSVIFFINLIYVLIFYKELKILMFDKNYAFMKGIKVNFLFYLLMTLTSLTSVAAFNSVGAVLVISFFITPSATAFLIAKDMKNMILISIICSILNSVIGFLIAINLNISISGMCSAVGMFNCIMVIIFNKNGAISKMINDFKRRKKLNYDLVLLHIYRHKNNQIEIGYDTINEHLKWDKIKMNEIISFLIKDNFVERNEELKSYVLTNKGVEYVENILK